ncbi:MAG: hypothetical protein GKR93_03020 [Gammaproteobacteria bacterium]|nr:hypothetical protein [Gammaproteobacteria bacterium]
MISISRGFLAGIGFLLIVLLFTSPLSPYDARSLKQGWQLGHIMLFTVWTFLLSDLFLIHIKVARLCLIVFLTTLALGIIIELIQSFIGRGFSLLDLAFNLIGSSLGLSLLVYRECIHMPQAAKKVLYSLTAILLFYALTPVILSLMDEIKMYRSFPVLADFESKLELSRWEGDISIDKPGFSANEGNMLQVTLHTTQFSGTTLAYFPGNWTNYSQFLFDAYNPDTEVLSLTLRIHDESHYGSGRGEYADRFNQTFDLQSGWNAILIELEDIASAPQNRVMDMTRIQSIQLFTVDSPRTRFLYLDNIRLNTTESGK